MSIRVLDAGCVAALLEPADAFRLMRLAMVSVARGEVVQPIRQGVRPDGVNGLVGMMPGYSTTPGWFGVKVISVFPGNFDAGVASHQGMMLLFEPRNGAPRAIIDATELTAIRTAAASAVATDVLARAEASSLAIFGYGEQAARHIEALKPIRAFSSIVVWGRDPQRAQAFAAAQSLRHGVTVTVAETPRAAAQADVICTSTSALTPFLQGAWLRPGQHLNLVGSSAPNAAEADVEAVRAARCFYDYRENALTLCGEFRAALAAGVVGEDHFLASVGDVLEAGRPGRRGAGDITLFKSLGMVAEDIFAADHVLHEAERRGLGQIIAW